MAHAGEGVEALTQDRVQTFLWYGLPMKWLTALDHKKRVAASLARAFDLLALPRYAELCRSETTEEILDAYGRSHAEGKKAFRRADVASGIRPPELPELEWGAVMEWEEARALSSTADFLEAAVASGDLVPGARGWKARQQQLARAHLTTARIEVAGRSILDVITAERLEAWLEGRRSSARQRIVEPLADRLAVPVELPAGSADPLPPLRWLLERLVEGQALTQTRNLSRAFVHDAATRFGWWDTGLHGLPRSEDDLYDLWQTRQLAQRMGLIRRTGRKLTLTARGRSLLAGPEALWRGAAHAMVPDEASESATGEVALALLVQHPSLPADELEAAVAQVIHEEGWRDFPSGEPPGEAAIARSLYTTLNLCRALDLLAVGGHWRERDYGLTDIGHAAALEALRHRATGPRSNPLA